MECTQIMEMDGGVHFNKDSSFFYSNFLQLLWNIDIIYTILV